MVATQKDPLAYILAVAVLHIAALYLLILSPLVVGGLISSLGASEGDVGLLITLEILVAGLVSILMSPITVRVPAHIIAMTAGAGGKISTPTDRVGWRQCID